MLRNGLLALLLLWMSPVMAAGEIEEEILPDLIFPKVKFTTTMGDIVVELDRTKAPIAVNNFLKYVTKNHYNGTVFHRVIANFVVQGGGYDAELKERKAFPPIYNESGNGLKNQRYTIAMARQSSPHSATRQFYFNLNDNDSLDPGRRWGYTVFGYITEGHDVIEAISLVDTSSDNTWGWPNVPIEPVVVETAQVLLPSN